MRDYFYLGLYKLFSFLLWILPDAVIRWLMKGLAWMLYKFRKKRKKTIKRNLDLAFQPPLDDKEREEIIVHAYMNLIDTVFGLIKRNGMSKEKILKNVSFEGEEIVQQYIDAGKQIIFVTGHYGNWELLAQAMAITFDIRTVAVGRQLDSKAIDKILTENRERFKAEMVYKKGAMKGCIKAINKGKNIWILIDQHIRQNQSITVDFFGEKATHTPLASMLSRKFGLDMVPVFISTDDYIHYKVKIHEPIKALKTENAEQDLATLTQAQADIMEQVIKEDPKQWFWMHKRWKWQ